MSILLFAIFDADAARSALALAQRHLEKAQQAYDKAGRTVQARASSRNPDVRRRASAALTAALDALDECRATFESAQERVTRMEAAEKEAYAMRLVPEESAALRQHRESHNGP